MNTIQEQQPDQPIPKKHNALKKIGKGCLNITLVFLLLVTGLAIWRLWPVASEPPKYISEAEAEIITASPTPDVPKGTEGAPKNASSPPYSGRQYDIDQTMYALYAIEKALKEATTFKELTDYVLQKESDLVAPEVAALKRDLFQTYKGLLDSRDDDKQIKSIFTAWNRILLDKVTSTEFNISGAILDSKISSGANPEREKARLQEEIENKKLAEDIKRRIRKAEDELLAFYFRYDELYTKYMLQWDKLCSLRDEAFYASYSGQWDQAIAAANKAIQMAPNEKEAHVLLAMALIEAGDKNGQQKENPVLNNIQTASDLLEGFVGDRNSLYAPAHLLRGVIKMKQGNPSEAFVYFDQAAAYFPKHQEDLNDRLNLYKKRAYLRDSREGNRLWSLYKSLMSGSGYFSPEFQKARALHAQGKDQDARDKIFDHFQRRKNQGEWAKVLDDFRFANVFLGTEMSRINATADKAVVVKLNDSGKWTNLYANKIEINLTNNSSEDLHNVSVLLCVRFTDMFKNDYVSFPVEKTLAVLKTGETFQTDISEISKITKEELGKEKKFTDVIQYGAVLISDEVITWAKQASDLQPTPATSEKDEIQNTKKQSHLKYSLHHLVNLTSK